MLLNTNSVVGCCWFLICIKHDTTFFSSSPILFPEIFFSSSPIVFLEKFNLYTTQLSSLRLSFFSRNVFLFFSHSIPGNFLRILSHSVHREIYKITTVLPLPYNVLLQLLYHTWAKWTSQPWFLTCAITKFCVQHNLLSPFLLSFYSSVKLRILFLKSLLPSFSHCYPLSSLESLRKFFDSTRALEHQQCCWLLLISDLYAT